MWYDGYRMMGFGWGWVIILGILVLIVLGIIALIRYLRHPAQQSNRLTGDKLALDILNERYAKGEISDEEYRKKIRNNKVKQKEATETDETVAFFVV